MGKFSDEKYRPSHEELIMMRNIGQVMPTWWKRLPIIRHVRALTLCYKINKHYDRWCSLGMIAWNANFEYKVCNAIWNNLLLSEKELD